MEYIGIAALSIMALIILYMIYHIVIKKQEIKENGIPHSDKKEEVKYTIKKIYRVNDGDYDYFIYKDGSCISCKSSLKEAEKVIDRSINSPEEEEVYSKTINK